MVVRDVCLLALCVGVGCTTPTTPSNQIWGEPIQVTSGMDVNFVHFTADGGLIFVAGDTVYHTTVHGDPVERLFSRDGVRRAVESPDGQRVVFDDNFDIFVAAADGSEVRAVASDSVLWEFASSIHSDENRVVHVTIDDAAKEYGLWVRDLEGGAAQNLHLTHEEVLRHTRWSPDGNRISYFAIRDGKASLWIMNADGTGRIQLPPVTDFERQPSWSPDGRELVYSSKGEGDFDLWIRGVEGGEPRQLTALEGDEAKPGWSPDGRTIIFLCTNCAGVAGGDLYTISREGP